MSPVFCLKLQVETPPNPNHILQIKNGTWGFLKVIDLVCLCLRDLNNFTT